MFWGRRTNIDHRSLVRFRKYVCVRHIPNCPRVTLLIFSQASSLSLIEETAHKNKVICERQAFRLLKGSVCVGLR